MYSIHTAMIRGVEAIPVEVEVSVTPGLPTLNIVGMPDISVQESKARIRCAFKACGFQLPRLSVTVSLTPSELKKTGSGFDLPIAVAILAATGQIPANDLETCLFVGELALDGSVCEIRGSVAFELLARDLGLHFVSAQGSSLLTASKGASRYLASLSRLCSGVANLEQPSALIIGCKERGLESKGFDFADVYDQELAKRAICIAAAGRLGLLMVGPPGAGKTMLAKRIPSILPPLSDEELAEALLLYSVAAEDVYELDSGRRPFRAPHHSISAAGLIGGGRTVRPGEATLAHHGVLFLDELPEFANNVLQTLRQPLEQGQIRLVRADGAYTFPSEFQLVAAANPCPCGHLGETGAMCRCSELAIQRYQSKLAGPLVDRIDIQIFVSKPDPQQVIDARQGMSSADMAAIVERAQHFREERCKRRAPQQEGGAAPLGTQARGVAELDFSPEAKRQLELLSRKLAWGGRGIVRVARVARTVADIEEHTYVQPDDVFEASTYRPKTIQGA